MQIQIKQISQLVSYVTYESEGRLVSKLCNI